MEAYDLLKELLVHRSGLPKWTISVLLEAVVLPLVAFEGLSKLLEGAFHLESPASQIIPACLTLALYWLVLIHYLSRRPFWIIGALAALLAIVCVATFKLWILYHTSPTTEAVSLSVPFFVVAAALFIVAVVMCWTPLNHQGRSAVTKRIAAVVGVTVFAAILAVTIVRPDEWYFIADTIFAEEIPEGTIGVLLAPYNRDPDDDARTRMQGDLDPTTGLLSHDPALAKQVKLVLLRRPIPGFEGGGGREKQREIAQQIALYDGARVLVTGRLADTLLVKPLAGPPVPDFPRPPPWSGGNRPSASPTVAPAPQAHNAPAVWPHPAARAWPDISPLFQAASLRTGSQGIDRRSTSRGQVAGGRLRRGRRAVCVGWQSPARMPA